jgi:DNA-binding beta-propeller fold protein YncE
VFSYSETGSITRVMGGVQQRIVTGLPSIGSATIAETTGPQDIVFGPGGTGYVVIGLGTNPAARTTDLAPGGANLGGVFTFNDGGGKASFADVSAFEGANNPAGGPVDSNPFHGAALADGLLVTDAGANSLLKVGLDGSVSLVAAFPSRFIGPPPPFSEPVPTGIAVGPDGNYYVAELTGFPFTQGAARIYKVTPQGDVSVFMSGLTNITDIAFGGDGTLYVLELDDNGRLTPGGSGALLKVSAGGTFETLFSGMDAPTGLAIGPDGAFYVTNFSASQGQGQVLRIAAVPESATWAMLIIGFGLAGAAARHRRCLAWCGHFALS